MQTFQRSPYILFADDDESTLDIFRHYVAELGWQAEYVKTAGEIIAEINKQTGLGRTVEALVCDVNFFSGDPNDGPRISGVAAAREIRRSNPDLPIVFVTAYSSYLIADEINGIGGEMFAKPVNFEKLFERLAYLIRLSRQGTSPIERDRRRKGLNLTGENRRATDSRIEIPEILRTANAEIRLEKQGRAGH